MSLIDFTINDNQTGIITLNRPEALNALNRGLLQDIHSTVADIQERDDIGALIITGHGHKAFAAGADVQEMKDMNPTSAHEFSLYGQSVFHAIESLRIPVIASIEGFCLGGGCELALACHIRIASETAIFGQPEVGLGLICGFGGSVRLPELIGAGRAFYWLSTGAHIPAPQAHHDGLLSHLSKSGEALEDAQRVASMVVKKSPFGIAATMQALKKEHKNRTLAFSREARLFSQCFANNDAKEGIGAFLSKQKPHFQRPSHNALLEEFLWQQ